MSTTWIAWIRRRLFSICWNIGDTFLGWSFKFEDGRDGGVLLNLHADCQPNQVSKTITLLWDPFRQGFVSQPNFSNTASSTPNRPQRS